MPTSHYDVMVAVATSVKSGRSLEKRWTSLINKCLKFKSMVGIHFSQYDEIKRLAFLPLSHHGKWRPTAEKGRTVEFSHLHLTTNLIRKRAQANSHC